MCGIAAFIGDSISEKTKLLIKLIALRQDTRGGDGAGFGYFEDKVPIIVKGAPTTENIKDITRKNTFKEDVTAINVSTIEELLCLYQDIPSKFDGSIIFHSRKTTSASSTTAFSHPFVYPKITEGENKSEEYLIGVHNGTIYNIDEIAKEVNYPVMSSYSDSQVLLYALATNQMPAIYNKLIGSMVLLWAESDKPGELFVIVKSNPYNNSKASRPLHFYMYDNACFISSESYPLYTLRSLTTFPVYGEDVESRTLEPVYAFPKDVVYSITKNKRKVVYTFNVETPAYDKSKLRNIQQKVPFKADDKGNSVVVPKQDSFNIKGGYIGYYEGLYRTYLGAYVCTSYKKVKGDIEIIGGHLYGENGEQLYEINKKVHHKVLHHNKNTFEYIPYKGDIYELYFWKGALLKSKEDFIELISITKNPSTLSGVDMLKYSKYPIPRYISQNANSVTGALYATYSNNIEYHPLFAYTTYHLINGLLADIEYKSKEFYKNHYNLNFEYENNTLCVPVERVIPVS